MNLLVAEKFIELDNIRKFIDVFSTVCDIPTESFSIMGGHARRLFMLHNGIEMTDADINSWNTADIDIFCHIKHVLGDDVMRFVECVSDKTAETLSYDELPCEIFDFGTTEVDQMFERSEKEKLTYFHNALTDDHTAAEMVDWVVKARIVRFIDKIVPMFGKEENSKYIKEHIAVHGANGMYSFSEYRRVDVGDLFKDFSTDSLKDMTECTVSDKPYSDPSFKASSKHLSLTIPLGHKIQLVFGNTNNDVVVNTFDLPQSKFKLDYPYDIDSIEWVSYNEFDIDNFYHVTRLEHRDISPFRIMVRLMKYSRYGFTYSDGVVQDVYQHIEEFVDGNPIQACATYTSSLY